MLKYLHKQHRFKSIGFDIKAIQSCSDKLLQLQDDFKYEPEIDEEVEAVVRITEREKTRLRNKSEGLFVKKIGEGICFKFLNRKWGDVRSSARKESQALIELEEKARLQKGSVGLFYEQDWRLEKVFAPSLETRSALA